MLSEQTRNAVSAVATRLVNDLPSWRQAIQGQAAKGVTYQQWRKLFQPMMDIGYLDAIVRRSKARGEDPEELLRCFWEVTRRAAGVPVPEEKCTDDENI